MELHRTTHAYASVACPECGAKSGYRCLSKRQRPMGNEFHKDRKNEWMRCNAATDNTRQQGQEQ